MGRGYTGDKQGEVLHVSLSVDDVLLLNIIVHFDALSNAHRWALRVDVTEFKEVIGKCHKLKAMVRGKLGFSRRTCVLGGLGACVKLSVYMTLHNRDKTRRSPSPVLS